MTLYDIACMHTEKEAARQREREREIDREREHQNMEGQPGEIESCHMTHRQTYLWLELRFKTRP